MSVCVNCRSPLVVIDLHVGDGRVRMRSCSSCGTRTWVRGDETVELDHVLGTARAEGQRRRPPLTDPPGVA